MELTGLAKKVFEDRYQQNGETVEEMWLRIAKAVATAEKGQATWGETFYKLLKDFRFVPGGRIMAAAGVEPPIPYFNCYVGGGLRDDTDSIYNCIRVDGNIMRNGGGVGRNFSVLRPKDCPIKGTGGKSSGVVTWMNLFSENANTIRQGGSRRGAFLGMLEVWHPDIIDFIEAKANDSHILQYMNLSVGVTDAFMEAVKTDASWNLLFPETRAVAYDASWDGNITNWKKRGLPVQVYKTISARDLWRKICESAWKSGEPGVIFIDRYNELNNSWYFQPIATTNPCGELGLPEYGVCNLGSINLAYHVKYGKMDWETLESTVRAAVRFLDDVIDVTPYVFPENEKVAKESRRIGLGTMGLADTLLKLKLRYGGTEANEFVEKLYKFIRDTAYNYSIELAREKGSFPKFDRNSYLEGEFINELPENIRAGIRNDGIRNCSLLTLAPTGSTGILAGVSSGIEPVFAWEYKRYDSLGEHTVMHPLYGKLVKGAPLPDYFVTATELTPEEHVTVQGIVQKYIDSSISKTTNAPNSHTVEDVERTYILAYDKGCKGVTYFRDGCNREGVLRVERNSDATGSVDNTDVGVRRQLKPAMQEAVGRRYKLKTGCGSMWAHTYRDEDGICETFITPGAKGGCNSFTIATSRMISLAMRYGAPVEVVVDQLESVPPCVSYTTARAKGKDVSPGASCPSAIAQLLKNEHAQAEQITNTPVAVTKEEQCNHPRMRKSEGCLVCPDCGYSKCD